MSEKLDLMGVSELWRKMEDAGGLSLSLEDVAKIVSPGLEYVERMSEVFNRELVEGQSEDVTKAVADVSHFTLLMYVLSIVKSVSERGPSSIAGGPVFIDAFDKLLRRLDDDGFRQLVETIVSVAIMVGIGISIDEGFTRQKTR